MQWAHPSAYNAKLNLMFHQGHHAILGIDSLATVKSLGIHSMIIGATGATNAIGFINENAFER